MVRYIATAVISAFVAATLVFGQMFTENSCDRLTSLIESAYESIENGDPDLAEKSIEDAVSLLSKTENIHFILSDHESYDELNANLKISKHLITHNEESLAGAYILLARDTAEKLKDAQSYGIGDVL